MRGKWRTCGGPLGSTWGQGPAPLPVSGRSVARPLLVAAAVARPQLQQGAVGGPAARGVQAEPGLTAGDRAVGVDGPLLVAAAVAGVDVHLGAGAGALARGVQAVVA